MNKICANLVLLAVGGVVLSGCRTMYTEDCSLTKRPLPSAMDETTVDEYEIKPILPAKVKPAQYWQQVEMRGSTVDAEIGKLNAKNTAYTVQAGDTLSGIGSKFGVRWADVAAINGLKSPYTLRKGQVIYLPGQVDLSKAKAVKTTTKKATSATTTPGTYIVKKGDILGRIANVHGVKVAELKKANNLTSDVIRVGQKLFIPPKSQSSAAKKSTVTPKAATTTTTTTIAPKKPIEVPVESTSVYEAAPVVTTPEEVKVAPATVSTITYIVQEEGVELVDLAISHDVSEGDICKINNLPVGAVLHKGQKILIPVK